MSLTNFQYFTSAYGGFTYDCNGYRIHKFNQSGILTITNIGLVDVLVVGGGAGGGVNAGGGAGGVIYQSNIPVQLGQINITVGDGGYAYPDTTNGTSSSFSNIILAGGGNIGADLYQGGISGTPQSYPGNSVSIPYGGGGGGASGLITINNNGIYGLSNSISGDFQYYGGGGGGCGCNLLYQGIGGLGGGGSGIYAGNNTIINAIPNTGGGGGACGNSIYSGGKGGSGIVIVRYTIPETKVFTLTSSNILTNNTNFSNVIVPTKIYPSISTANLISNITINNSNYQIHQFTSNGIITLSSQSSIGYIDVLVVGGGGGGSSYGILGSSPGNGGGGGQVIYQQNLLINALQTGTTYSIIVGNGGQSNQNGESSSFNPYIIAKGGFAGTSNGGGLSGNSNYVGNYYLDYINSTFVSRGGGGGGAGKYGISASYITSGLGGDGINSDITGTLQYYGTGGGGGGLKSQLNGWLTDGANGGNNNINNGKGGGSNTLSQAATSNTGGGGGGAGQGTGAGDYGSGGGSGIVILRLLCINTLLGVTNIIVTNPTSSTVDITWTQSSGANLYLITSTPVTTTQTTSNILYTFTGLSTLTNYIFTITSIGINGIGGYTLSPSISTTGVSAVGGTINTYSLNGINYKIHIFTTSGTFIVTSSGNIDVLVVGGGGAGVSYSLYQIGGGGGGGQVIYQTNVSISNGSYSCVVGAGGSNSSFNSIIALKGQDSVSNYSFNGGTSGSGQAGGSGSPSAGGGGGGDSAAGASASGTKNGGNGTLNSISGIATYYGGGGGGGGFTRGTGGLGGGGNGGGVMGGAPIAQSGTANTGGGGGGSGGNGGSGIIIIRYKI